LTGSKGHVVIGAGASGLFTALLLSRAGHEVTVIEKNRQAGGLMRSYTRRGVDCPVGIHYLGSLGEGQILRRFFDHLGVMDRIPVIPMGVDGPIDRFVTSSGRSFDLPSGIDRLFEALVDAFPHDEPHIARLTRTLHEAAAYLHEMDFSAGQSRGSWIMEHLKGMGRIAEREGWSEDLQEVLALVTSWTGVLWGSCPEHLFATSLASYLSSSWRLARGGAHVAEVLRSRLIELGGTISLGDEVTSVEVAGGAVQGVEMASGRRLPASQVISSLHPTASMNLLGAGTVRPSYRSRITRLRDTSSCVCVHALIPSKVQPPRGHNLLWARDGRQDPKTQFFQLVDSGREGFTLLTVLEADALETWREWLGTKTGHRGASYAAAKNAKGQALLADAEAALGPLGRAEIIDTYTPLTVRDWMGIPSGSAYCVSHDTTQQIKAALLHRTPVKGLHLTGQSVTAPGIVGAAVASLLACECVM
jgi:all-trans-retinol 13,14-reductase